MRKNSPFPPFTSFLAAGLMIGLAPSLHAQWQPVAAGDYSYSDTDNWAGGIINGQFSNAITGAQVISFSGDTVLPGGTLSFENLSAGGMVWQSDTADIARVLSFGSSVTTLQVKAGALAIGTSSHPLTLDLGSNTSILSPLSTGEIIINAKLTGGATDKYLSVGNSSSARGLVHLTNDANDFVSNLRLQRISTFQVSSVADGGVASAIGAGSTIRFQHTSGTAKFVYVGSGHSTNRLVELASSAPIEIWNSGTGKLTFSGEFTRTGSEDAALFFRGDSDIEISGIIGDSLDVGKLAVTKLGSQSTLILSAQNSFSGPVTIAEGTVRAGHNNAFGTGSVEVRANTSLAVDRGIQLQVSSLEAAHKSHFTFDLGQGEDAGALFISGDLTGDGVFTVDLTSDVGLVNGTYTLLNVTGNVGDVSFVLGQLIENYDLNLIWQNKTLSVTVTSIPEASTSALLLGAVTAAAFGVCWRRR